VKSPATRRSLDCEGQTLRRRDRHGLAGGGGALHKLRRRPRQRVEIALDEVLRVFDERKGGMRSPFLQQQPGELVQVVDLVGRRRVGRASRCRLG
jgi:hypothetical protein